MDERIPEDTLNTLRSSEEEKNCNILLYLFGTYLSCLLLGYRIRESLRYDFRKLFKYLQI